MRTNRVKRADHPPLSPQMKTKARIICPCFGKMSLPRLVAKLQCFPAETGAAGKADEFSRRRALPLFIESCENQNDRQGYRQRNQQNEKPQRDFQTKQAFLFHTRRLPSNVVAKTIIAIDNPSLSPNVSPIRHEPNGEAITGEDNDQSVDLDRGSSMVRRTPLSPPIHRARCSTPRKSRRSTWNSRAADTTTCSASER